MQLSLQKSGRDDVPTGGGKEGHISNHGYNFKMRAGVTYRLRVERDGDVSDCSSKNKTRSGLTYLLEVERATSQMAVPTTKRGQGQHTCC